MGQCLKYIMYKYIFPEKSLEKYFFLALLWSQIVIRNVLTYRIWIRTQNKSFGIHKNVVFYRCTFSSTVFLSSRYNKNFRRSKKTAFWTQTEALTGRQIHLYLLCTAEVLSYILLPLYYSIPGSSSASQLVT
jgi:hypothetical protein